MKKLVIACFAVLSLAACKQGKTNGEPQLNDSLQQIIQQRDNQLNDMMATMNEIQDGFRQINEAENHVNIAKDGEGANKSEQIKVDGELEDLLEKKIDRGEVVLNPFGSKIYYKKGN